MAVNMRHLPIRDGFALFWGQWPSNWEHSPFILERIRYSCVEHFMMAEKARLFNDNDTLKAILATDEPREHKKLGRLVKGFTEAKWAEVRYDVVLRGTLEKYRQNKHLLDLLLATENLTFVEASPEDRIWGIGMRRDDPRATHPEQWLGLNLLGKAINEAREILRAESKNYV
jgi:ribA/ribD-fused uncharacterized protein